MRVLGKPALRNRYSSPSASLLLIATVLAAGSPGADTKAVVEYQYRVVASYPHDTAVFTQGLEFHHGLLFESAGKRGESRVFTRTLENVSPIQQQPLAKQFFAEGITLLNAQLYQLTWQAERGFIYDPKTLQRRGEFSINGEGWGLTNNGSELIMSNGSHQLQFLDPGDFSVKRTLDVTFEGKPLNRLNELEWVDGLIYANVWMSNWIVMINPKSGAVVGKVFLKDLLAKHLRTTRTDVLNGIAYDRDNKRLFVTGKYWPLLFHIELLHDTPAATPNPLPAPSTRKTPRQE